MSTSNGEEVKSGQPIPLAGLPLGTHTLVITAKDKAGNTSTKMVTFTTTTSYADVRSLVESYRAAGAISRTDADKLVRSITDADTAATNGRTAEAVAHLNTFLHRAEALRSPNARDVLVRDARALKAALGA